MTFTIDLENNITVLASSQHIEERQEGTETFSTPHELAALAAKWPGSRLIEIWNGLPGVEAVERFTSRKVAATRIWSFIAMKTKGTLEFPGSKSPVRFSAGVPLDFIIRPTADPMSAYCLRQLASKKKIGVD